MSILDKASLIQIPSGYKEDKLYSLKPRNGEGDFQFTRASTGTRVNADGYIEEVPWNIVQRSEEFNSAYWTDAGFTITENDSTSPIGNTTANKLVINSAATQAYIYRFESTIGEKTFSVYAKKGVKTWLMLACLGATKRVFFDLDNGVIGTNVGSLGASISDEGDGWYRCSITFTYTSGNSAVYFYVTDNDNTFNVTGNDSDELYLWGAMINKGTSVKPYIKTTDRLDVPRLDYSDGSCASLLLEPQSTNLIPNSNQYAGNTVYYTVTSNQSSPDGENNATLFVEKTSTSPYTVNSVVASIVGGQTYSYSFFVKYAGKQNIPVNATDGVSGYLANIDILNGVVNSGNAEIKDFGNGWYRVSMTRTVSASASQAAIQFNFGNITGDGTSGFYLFGYQVEQQSYATSYIPTSGSTVTRTADSFQSVNASNWSSVEGTINLNLQAFEGDNTYRQFSLYGSGNDSLVISYTNTTNQVTSIMKVGGSTVFYMATTLTDASDLNKIAFAYSSGRAKLFINGVQRGTSSASYTTSEGVWTKFCSNIGASYNYYFGKVYGIYISKTALTDEELTTLTTI